MPPRFPSSSLAGKRTNTWLANGYIGVLTGILGDLDYMCQTLQLPRWSRNINSCALCLCDAQGPYSWKVFKPDAPWVSKCWTPSTWSAWEGRSKCGLFEIRHLTAVNVQCDYMHAKYLGTDLVAFASVLWLAIFVAGSQSPAKNLADFQKHLKSYYQEHNTASRFSAFNSYKYFMNKKGMKLKGKAAQVKAFGQPLLEFWQKVYNPSVSIHKLVLVYMKLNVKCEELMDANRDEIHFSNWTCKQFQPTPQLYVMLHLLKTLFLFATICFHQTFHVHLHEATQMQLNSKEPCSKWHTCTMCSGNTLMGKMSPMGCLLSQANCIGSCMQL